MQKEWEWPCESHSKRQHQHGPLSAGLPTGLKSKPDKRSPNIGLCLLASWCTWSNEMWEVAKFTGILERHQHGCHPFGTWARISTKLNAHIRFISPRWASLCHGPPEAVRALQVPSGDMYLSTMCDAGYSAQKRPSSCWFCTIPFGKVPESKRNFFFPDCL